MKIFNKIKEYKDAKIALIKKYIFKADCDIKEPHAHRFINKYGFTKYIDSEKQMYFGYERQDDYITISDNEKELFDFLNKKGLLRIIDNVPKIIYDQRRNRGFYQYEYEYEEEQQIPIITGSGKDQSITYITTYNTEYDWTKDINHSDLTGYRRWCEYRYTSYKIIRNKRGKLKAIPLNGQKDLILNFNENNYEYCYIDDDYYYVIHFDKEKFDIKEEREKIKSK